MVGQYEELSCPFCDKGIIQVLHVPSVYSMQRVKSGKGKSTVSRKSSEVWLFKSGCSTCSKTAEEVERKFKEVGIL